MTATSRPSGLDLRWIDPEVRLQDDLFGHVNGTWLREHTIPADRAMDGAFTQLRDISEENVRAIIEECAAEDLEGRAPTTDDERIGAVYRLFMDEAAVESAGVTPLEPLLGEITGAGTLADLTRVMAAPDAGTSLVHCYVWTDDADSSRYQVHLHQAGIGLPERSYYVAEQYAPIREQYVEHLRVLADLAALPGREGLVDGDAAALATSAMELEMRIAEAHVDVVRLRDREKSYNPTHPAGLRTMLPELPWDAYFEGTGAPESALAEVNVGQPEYFAALRDVLGSADLSQLRTWLALSTVSTYAPYLSSAFVQASFAFQGTVLSGAEEIRERWKRGVALVESTLGMAVGRRYVQRHFPPSHKERMDALVDSLMDAYRTSISQLEWMTEATRQRAIAKLEKFTPKIGYPARWRSYEGLEVNTSDLIATVRASRCFEAAHEFAKVAGPVDEDEWHMTPQTVNAYYNPGRNEIVFPAAILQPPFFTAEADDAVNYGGIGAVIGHEIGHGFDDQGSKYDGDGNLVSWWTPEDRAAFEALTQSLIDQYSSLTPRQLGPSHHVNGELTIGENIGDLGGLSIAVKAYLATAEDPEAELDGLTGLQRVFWSWATIWRAVMREPEAIRRLATDPHSPTEFRCNTVASHIDSFHDAFSVTEADGMHLPPALRVSIW